VRGADTAVAWWRQQTRGRGLSDGLERTFRGWAHETTRRWSEDDANNELVAASLTASFAGDQSDWRYVTGLLGRDRLVRLERHDDPGKAEVGLTRIRRSGDTKAVKLATQRLMNDGPALAVRAAAAQVSLSASTATTIGADLDLLGHAGPVLDNDTANRTVTWILGSLSDPSAFIGRTRPRFDIAWRLLNTLAPILPSSSEEVHAEVIDHLVSQPPVHDQLASMGWRKVIRQLDASAWTGDTIARASGRKRSDSPDEEELRYALLKVTNDHDPATRETLLAEIKEGSLDALGAIGDVRTLDPETVRAALVHANAAIRQVVNDAHQHSYRLRARDPGQVATLLCLWHHDHADWGPILDLLTDPLVDDDAKYLAVKHLANLAHRIPDLLRERLAQIAGALITHQPTDHSTRDIRGPATLLQAALSATGEDNAEQLHALVRGSKQQRIWAARLARHHVSAESTGLVAGLCQDHEPEVRAACAAALTTLVATTDNPSLLLRTALGGALDDPGFLVPDAIAATLADLPNNTETSALASRLAEHPFAPVRRHIDVLLAAWRSE
jgi:HEAT repeat